MGRKKKEIEISADAKIKLKNLKEPETKKEYVQGLDSNYIMNHMPKSTWQHPSIETLKHANKELGTSYENWHDLSKHGKLSEAFLTKYEADINWYQMFMIQKNDKFSEKFKKKYKSKFMLISLDLV